MFSATPFVSVHGMLPFSTLDLGLKCAGSMLLAMIREMEVPTASLHSRKPAGNMPVPDRYFTWSMNGSRLDQPRDIGADLRDSGGDTAAADEGYGWRGRETGERYGLTCHVGYRVRRDSEAHPGHSLSLERMLDLPIGCGDGTLAVSSSASSGPELLASSGSVSSAVASLLFDPNHLLSQSTFLAIKPVHCK